MQCNAMQAWWFPFTYTYEDLSKKKGDQNGKCLSSSVLGKTLVIHMPTSLVSQAFPCRIFLGVFFFLIAVGEQTKLSRVPQCCKHWQATK
jgi:hypothetical protein